MKAFVCIVPLVPFELLASHLCIAGRSAWLLTSRVADECFDCVAELFFDYFSCATSCTRDSTSLFCTDCSFVYSNLHADIIRLREKIWHAFYLKAFDDYVFADLLEADFRSCATDGKLCAVRDHFECQAYGTGPACVPDTQMVAALSPPAAPSQALGETTGSASDLFGL